MISGTFFDQKQRLFDCWAPSYDWLFPSVFYQTVHRRLLDYVHLPETANVLDLGCGTGRLLNRLAAHFPNLRGTGLDLSPNMLRQARQRNRHHPRLIFIQGNVEALPFAKGQFDAVFSTLSFLHYPRPEQVMAQISRVLRSQRNFYLADIERGWQNRPTTLAVSAGGVRFYSPEARTRLGQQAGLPCLSHHYLVGPVLLTIFAKP